MVQKLAQGKNTFAGWCSKQTDNHIFLPVFQEAPHIIIGPRGVWTWATCADEHFLVGAFGCYFQRHWANMQLTHTHTHTIRIHISIHVHTHIHTTADKQRQNRRRKREADSEMRAEKDSCTRYTQIHTDIHTYIRHRQTERQIARQTKETEKTRHAGSWR